MKNRRWQVFTVAMLALSLGGWAPYGGVKMTLPAILAFGLGILTLGMIVLLVSSMLGGKQDDGEPMPFFPPLGMAIVCGVIWYFILR